MNFDEKYHLDHTRSIFSTAFFEQTNISFLLNEISKQVSTFSSNYEIDLNDFFEYISKQIELIEEWDNLSFLLNTLNVAIIQNQVKHFWLDFKQHLLFKKNLLYLSQPYTNKRPQNANNKLRQMKFREVTSNTNLHQQFLKQCM